MSYKVICPFHKEDTPSCTIYDDKYYCYGCGKHGPISELGMNLRGIGQESRPVVKEDLVKSFARINALPKKLIRGLVLPYDDTGYYITFEDQSYYKKRLWDGKQRYVSPKGHKKPAMHLGEWSKVCAIVEGEINALSLERAGLDLYIISPGSATDLANYGSFVVNGFERYKIIVDGDAAGVLAAIKLKTKLLDYTPNVDVILMGEQDLNDLLVMYGEKEFKSKMATLLEVLGTYESNVRVSGKGDAEI